MEQALQVNHERACAHPQRATQQDYCKRLHSLIFIQCTVVHYAITYGEGVVQEEGGPEREAHALDCEDERLDAVRRVLEEVGPRQVEQVLERVLAAEAEHAERHLSCAGERDLPVHQVAREQICTWAIKYLYMA